MFSPSRLPALLLLATLACHRPAAPPAAEPRGDHLPDSHVAGIALVANNVEIGYALLAPGRVADADVRAYAARMHTDHTSLNATLTDLLARLDLPADEDPAADALREASAARRTRLRALAGAAFDSAYVDTDLASHRELLALIDTALAPDASRAELRQYVAALRPAVAAHLAHAEQLRATLAERRR